MVASVRPWKAPLKVMMRQRSGCAVGEVIAAGKLDGALAGFRAGVAEEHLVGEGRRAQALGKPFLAGDAIEVGSSATACAACSVSAAINFGCV